MTIAPTRAHRAPGTRATAPLTGLAAVVGGLAWTVAAVLHSRQPVGCVGESCGGGVAMRESTTATTVLVGLAVLLLAASGWGLLRLVHRAGGLGRPGRTGAVLAVLGTLSVVAGAVTQAVLGDDDAPWMPWFVWPGVAAVALGAVLFGWTVLRSGVVPRWVGAALVAGAVLLVLANEQTTAVLLSVPFGLAWVAAGTVLLRRR